MITSRSKTMKYLIIPAFIATALVALLGTSHAASGATKLSAGVTLSNDSSDEVLHELSKAHEDSSLASMNESGLAVVLGGAELKLLQSRGHQEIILPIPQQAPAQIPIQYALVAEPAKAARDLRLCRRGKQNMVVRLKLKGNQNDVIKLRWAAIVLLTDAPNKASPDSVRHYQKESACVQSKAKPIATLSSSLGDASDPESFATSIQKHVREMEHKGQVRSMDALGMLEAGANWICTANANLAAALLRHQKIASRTLAVVPVNGQRLEMHRAVEFVRDGHWLGFDPSGVHADVPLPSRNQVVMAITTIADEEVAMKPRMAVAPGAPYGHEIEMLSQRVALHGKEFFWTSAKPLAHFKVSSKTAAAAGRAWETFLRTGKRSLSQRRAGAARDAKSFEKAWGRRIGL